MALHDIPPEKTYPFITDAVQRAIVNFQQTYLGRHTIAIDREGVVYYRDGIHIRYREFILRDLKFWTLACPEYDHIPFDWNMVEMLN